MSGAETGHHAISTTLEGSAAYLLDPSLNAAARAEIIEKAFDFRGDVVITCRDGRTVSGYLFDRRKESAGSASGGGYVRVMPPPPPGADAAGSLNTERVDFDDIAKIDFGKDAAHGKTWENWVKRYVEKKKKGESASIEAEVL